MKSCFVRCLPVKVVGITISSSGFLFNSEMFPEILAENIFIPAKQTLVCNSSDYFLTLTCRI